MSILRCFQVVTVLISMVLSIGSYQHQASKSCVQATNIEEVFKERGIGRSYGNVDDLARAPTEAAGQLHNELIDTERTFGVGSSKGITKDHDGQGLTPAIAKAKLPSERKAEIAEKLASHRKKIDEMRIEWQGIETFFEYLQKNIEDLKNMTKLKLKMNVKLDSRKTADDIMEELTIFYKYISHLVENRLRELGGLGGILIGTKRKKMEESCIFEGLGSQQINGAKNDLVKGDKNVQASKQKLKSPQTTKFLGHSALHVVLRENIKSQRESLGKPDVSSWPDPTFEEDVRDLHQDPSDIISEKLKAERLQDLNTILHSFTFLPAPEAIVLSEHEIRRVTTTAFDFIFKVLQFMYKFEIINKGHLKSFFSTHETQELTGVYLTDLLNVYWGGFWGKINLLPEMSLITSHWSTQHLHTLLKALDENQVKSIAHKILNETLRTFSYAEGPRVRFQPTVHGVFSEKEFLSRLEKCDDLNYKDMELRSFLKKITEYFQNPIPTPSGPPQRKTQMIDYLLTYCAIKFIKDHHPKVLESSFDTGPEYEVFQSQFSLIQEGLNLHQQANEVLEYELLLQNNYSIQNSIPKPIAQKRIDKIKKDLKELTIIYIELWIRVLKLSQQNFKVNDWMKERSISRDIIKFMTGKAFFIETKPDLMEKVTPCYRNSFLL